MPQLLSEQQESENIKIGKINKDLQEKKIRKKEKGEIQKQECKEIGKINWFTMRQPPTIKKSIFLFTSSKRNY